MYNRKQDKIYLFKIKKVKEHNSSTFFLDFNIQSSEFSSLSDRKLKISDTNQLKKSHLTECSNATLLGGVKSPEHCKMGQNCGKNIIKPFETKQNYINSSLSTAKDQLVSEKTEYDDYIVKQAKKLYKNQKVSPEEINLRYDALKRKELFKTITDLNFNTFVAYRHLIAIAITFENDHGKSVDHYLKKYGLF